MSPEAFPKGAESSEQRERGANVTVLLKFIRHGERTKEGELTDLGRRITRERAREKRLDYDDLDAVKAVGSPAGPTGPTGMQRSLETAHIYMQEIPRDKDFATRARGLLSYETLKIPSPYDHVAVYNSFLPEHFDTLPDVEKIAAAKKAQAGTLNHVFSIRTPEAEQFRKENAGAFAVFVEHYADVAKRLKSGSRVLIPAGTHGGTMEYLLQQALVHRDREGREVVGFNRLDDIAGEFDPSEAYNVFVETDEQGAPKRYRVTFDNPNRPQQEMYLDAAKVAELKDFYLELHKDD